MPDFKQLLIKCARFLRRKIFEWSRVLGQVLYGMTVYDIVRDLNKERDYAERLFVLMLFGDMLGVPILTPYYSMRLLPFVCPRLSVWKVSLFRERDLSDLCDKDIT